MTLLGWEKFRTDNPDYEVCASPLGDGGATGRGGGTIGRLRGLDPRTGVTFDSPAGFLILFLQGPYLTARLRRRFEDGSAMSDGEIRQACEAMGEHMQEGSAQAALHLVAQARMLVARGGYRLAAMPPRLTPGRCLVRRPGVSRLRTAWDAHDWRM